MNNYIPVIGIGLYFCIVIFLCYYIYIVKKWEYLKKYITKDEYELIFVWWIVAFTGAGLLLVGMEISYSDASEKPLNEILKDINQLKQQSDEK